MIITHVYHSGFVLELNETVLIFDWYSGELPIFDTAKKVIVLVTHGHPDHYSPRIWELQKRCKRISYVLDCCTAPERKGDNILHVQPGRHYETLGARIFAIRSNDEGVAYVVSVEGCNFFHAGDLNARRCENSEERCNAYSLKIFRRQMEKISGLYFDAAMLPLDPRLHEYAPMAIVEFLKTVTCAKLFPMHYWNRREEAAAYLDDERLLPYRDRICFQNVAKI